MITMTKEEIKAINPHREPIQLVDEVTSLVPGKSVTAIFHIREDLPVLVGHFPGNPVFPGVYSIESMAQTANLMILTKEQYAGKTPLLLAVNNARFRFPVKPGDTVTIECEVTEEKETKAVITCACKYIIDGKIAAEADVVIAPR